MSDNSSQNQNKNTPPNNFNQNRNNSNNNGGYRMWLIISIILLVVGVVYLTRGVQLVDTTVSNLQKMLEEGDVKDIVIVNKNLVEISLHPKAIRDKTKKYHDKLNPHRSPITVEQAPHFKLKINSIDNFEKKVDEAQKNLPAKIEVRSEERSDVTSFLLQWGVFFLMLFALWFLMARMAGGGAGGQIFNIGRSRAQLFDADSKIKITFNDVAGLDEAKEEIQEIVEFLKNPSKFTTLGAKIPKGALLIGPPGTGKTLLAKAVAGEAGVPFFSLSGSDFVEMFVGVGAARVRDLFKQAKEKAPCIIFIDEIDAIGRSRSRGAVQGGNDEKENTLNSLLVEMDGFATDSGVIILAATNRPDILDSALMRPGRFDRQISVDAPDVVGREAIFKVHLAPVKVSLDIDPKKLAIQTPGFAGAEIANVCNEAALIAARKNKTSVEMKDFQDAIDRVIGGLEKKNKLISPEEKEIIAYHEAGHAVTSWFLEFANPLVKVSIVPRGVAALGYAQYLPSEQYIYRTEQLLDEMCALFGGRAAEDIIFGKVSTGALNDLERITKIAHAIVTIYGMNDKIGNISFYDSKQSDYSFNKPYSDETAKVIDDEIRKIATFAYNRTKQILVEHREQLEALAKVLLKKEIIFQDDLKEILGERPFSKPTSYEAYVDNKKEVLPEISQNNIDISKSN